MPKSKIKIFTFEQGSEEWNAIRIGRLTGSEAWRVFNASNGELKTEWRSYAARCASEVVTGWSEERNFDTEATIYGKTLEPEAIDAYQSLVGKDYIQPGFVIHKDFLFLGFSPDGYAEDKNNRRSSIQVKCPLNPSEFVKFHVLRKVDPHYKIQCLYELALDYQLNKVNLVFYDERQPGTKISEMRYSREEYEPIINKLVESMRYFCDEVEVYISILLNDDKIAIKEAIGKMDR